MKVKIEKGLAKGSIKAPPSESMAHRLLICAGLAEGESTIKGISHCEDVLATLDCMNSLGIKTEINGDDVKVLGKDFRNIKANGTLCCRESGSTLRFLLPTAMLSNNPVTFTGSERLLSRPMTVYEDLAKEKGVRYESDGKSITVSGKLKGGKYKVVGNISSQFISGLIFALPLCDEDSEIIITPPIESRSYIDLTINAVKEFGIDCDWSDEYTIKIKGGSRYTPATVTVEGDYSNAAFLDALNLLGGEVEVLGLNSQSIQGDKVYQKYYKTLSLGIPTIHIGDCPDLGPILFALSAGKQGGIFSGTKRLKIKESDRAMAMATELQKFGVSVSVYEDSVVVYPLSRITPTEELYGHNDHRIVMALAVLLTTCGGVIDGAEAVNKSYPEFFNNLRELGIEAIEYDD